MATKDDINRLDTKLAKFEERETDKRLQLEVRVSAIEKPLGLDKKIAASTAAALKDASATAIFQRIC